MNDYDFAGKTVLITGASMGIGAVFARALAQLGSKLILVARSKEKLEAIANEIGGAQVIVADLTAPNAAQDVFDTVVARGLTVDVLINNAGFGLSGPFSKGSLAVHREEIDLNVTALFEMTYLFLPMIEARHGGIMQVASVAGLQPIAYMAVYAAAKAFVVSFSTALWAEYRRRGVRVVCLVPGATETAFFERSGPGADPGRKARPEDVVQLGLKAFRAGRAIAIHGAANRAVSFLARFFGRELLASSTEKMLRAKNT